MVPMGWIHPLATHCFLPMPCTVFQKSHNCFYCNLAQLPPLKGKHTSLLDHIWYNDSVHSFQTPFNHTPGSQQRDKSHWATQTPSPHCIHSYPERKRAHTPQDAGSDSEIPRMSRLRHQEHLRPEELTCFIGAEQGPQPMQARVTTAKAYFCIIYPTT